MLGKVSDARLYEFGERVDFNVREALVRDRAVIPGQRGFGLPHEFVRLEEKRRFAGDLNARRVRDDIGKGGLSRALRTNDGDKPFIEVEFGRFQPGCIGDFDLSNPFTR